MYKTPKEVPAISGIYALICPESGKVRYVGQAKNIRARAFCHFRGDGLKSPKSAWVEKLRRKGLSPDIEILEETESLDEAEIRHIKAFGVDGLLNVHHGGEWEHRGIS